jgi:hypothetical protein
MMVEKNSVKNFQMTRDVIKIQRYQYVTRTHQRIHYAEMKETLITVKKDLIDSGNGC